MEVEKGKINLSYKIAAHMADENQSENNLNMAKNIAQSLINNGTVRKFLDRNLNDEEVRRIEETLQISIQKWSSANFEIIY